MGAAGCHDNRAAEAAVLDLRSGDSGDASDESRLLLSLDEGQSRAAASLWAQGFVRQAEKVPEGPNSQNRELRLAYGPRRDAALWARAETNVHSGDSAKLRQVQSRGKDGIRQKAKGKANTSSIRSKMQDTHKCKPADIKNAIASLIPKYALLR